MKPVVQAISKMKDFDQSLPLGPPSLSAAQKKTLQSKLPNTTIDFGFDGSEAIFPLNSPKITFDKMMFRDSMEVVISHPHQNSGHSIYTRRIRTR